MQWHPFLKRTAWSVLTAAVLLVAALWAVLRLSLPDLTGEQELRGLEKPVAVMYDEHGIPTIQAASRHDAYQALGYVTARDRLFQMDLFRRSASGRLAEIFGQDAVELDSEQRVFGFQQVAAAISARLSENERTTDCVSSLQPSPTTRSSGRVVEMVTVPLPSVRWKARSW